MTLYTITIRKREDYTAEGQQQPQPVKQKAFVIVLTLKHRVYPQKLKRTGMSNKHGLDSPQGVRLELVREISIIENEVPKLDGYFNAAGEQHPVFKQTLF